MRPERLKELACSCGFDAAGVAPVALLSDEVAHLTKWVEEGKNGNMEYLGRNLGVRENPALLVAGAKSVIVTLANYYNPVERSEDSPRIAMYAQGKDYHIVVKQQLFRLFDLLRQEAEETISGRCFTDSAPIFEHEWARRAGLGWIGKNTLLIHKGLGTYCFIGVIVTTLVFDEYDKPFTTSYCGNCTRCVSACPTGALTAGEVDARKCISYQTIENKGDYPENLKQLAGNRIFGCDACQEVCPWNKGLERHNIAEFNVKDVVQKLSYADWRNMAEEEFNGLFKDSPLKRAGLKQIVRNLTK